MRLPDLQSPRSHLRRRRGGAIVNGEDICPTCGETRGLSVIHPENRPFYFGCVCQPCGIAHDEEGKWTCFAGGITSRDTAARIVSDAMAEGNLVGFEGRNGK